MFGGLGIDAIVFLIGVAFVAGAIDAIAGGGGLLTIPALLSVGLPPVTAIGTNKLQSWMGTGSAVLTFARRGHIEFRRFALPALAAFIGSGCGAYLLTQIDSAFLSGFIPFLLIAMAVYFMLAPKMREEDRHVLAGPRLMLVFAFGIAAYDGFFGPGTGSFYMTSLVAVFGLGLTRAVAHTKFLNFASNFAAIPVMALGGHILWAVGLAMALGSVAGAQLGTRLALRFGANAVRPLLIIMCLALTAKLLADPANPLTAMVAGWF